jgi:hypothetical protein
MLEWGPECPYFFPFDCNIVMGDCTVDVREFLAGKHQRAQQATHRSTTADRCDNVLRELERPNADDFTLTYLVKRAMVKAGAGAAEGTEVWLCLKPITCPAMCRVPK